MARRAKNTIKIGDSVSVRRIRGPKPNTKDYYWRAEKYLGHGKRETIWTGWATKQEAQQHVAGLLASGAVEDGAIRQDSYGPSDVRSVKDLMAIWYGTTQEDSAVLAPETLRTRKNTVARLVEHMGHVHPSRVNEIMLTEYRDRRLRTKLDAGTPFERPVAPGTVFNEIRLLKQAWAWSRRQGLVSNDLYVPRNFIDASPVRPKPTPKIADLWQIVDWIRENAERGAAYHADVLTLVGATGMRIGAAAKATVRDVHHAGGEMTVVHKGEARQVPLTHEERVVVEQLCKGKAPTDRLFPRASEKNLPKCTRRMIRRACDALEMERITPHGFRRMVIEHLLDKGIDVGTVAALVGNSPATIYRYYRQVRPEQKRRAVALGAIGKRPDVSAEDAEVHSLDTARRTG